MSDLPPDGPSAEARGAPGAPGIAPRWTSSAKSGVGTGMDAISRVWFTLSHGILNEVYYPRLDQACIRDLGLIVTGPDGFMSEEKRDAGHLAGYLAEGTPAYHLVNICNDGRYRIDKRIITDPMRDVVLQQITFTALQGSVSDYRVYALLAPHLVNGGAHNTGWVGTHKGLPLLFAEGDDAALALACSTGWNARSVGYAGVSDGWRQLQATGRLAETWGLAADGNVALIGEIDLPASGTAEFVLALGFGRRPAEAAHRVLASLQDGFETALAGFVAGWRAWQAPLEPLDRRAFAEDLNRYRISTTVLRCHAAASFPGGCIASLSIPWGFNKGDEDLGGYHLVWPRDLVETAGGYLAAGAKDEGRQILCYLQATQEPDGHWPQNSWLDGTPYWTGVQMDECAFPILLYDLALRCGALRPEDTERFWPMVRAAAGFLVCNGPVTGQDRWEEDGGYSPFTLAVEIAALLAAADMAEARGETGIATYLRETADGWNADVERWTYARGTDLARQLGIDGYYVRIAPPDTADAASPLDGFVPIKNRPPADSTARASQIVSPDALALVRFGLRAPDDPRIVATVTAIDALLKLDTPAGPYWRRYNGDGYGEHEDGTPFDGTGIGRAWPLLTGERAHFELAAGRKDAAEALLLALEASANEGGMLPEQVWDKPDLPERELFFGKPTGSAMPLVWAHGEHIKLLRSLRDGGVFDMPPQTVRRYQRDRVAPSTVVWRFNAKRRTIPPGRTFRIETLVPASVHWSADGWLTVRDDATQATGLGTHVVDLSAAGFAAGQEIVFTFHWPTTGTWEGTNYQVTVIDGG